MNNESTYVSYDNIDCDVIFSKVEQVERNRQGNQSMLLTTNSKDKKEDKYVKLKNFEMKKENSNNHKINNPINEVSYDTSLSKCPTRRASFSESILPGKMNEENSTDDQVSMSMSWKPKRKNIKDNREKKSDKKSIQSHGVIPLMSLFDRNSLSSKNKTASDDITKGRRASTLPHKFNFDKIRSVTANTFQRKSKDKESAPGRARDHDITTFPHSSTVVKVFVRSLGVGANYKSIMVSQSTNAKDLLDMSLQRFNLYPDEHDRCVLCEVIRNNHAVTRNMKNNMKPEEFVRVLNDWELPAMLQSRWHDNEDEIRRFEVRKSSEVYKRKSKEKSKAINKDICGMKFLTQSINRSEENGKKFINFAAFDSLCNVSTPPNTSENTDTSCFASSTSDDLASTNENKKSFIDCTSVVDFSSEERLMPGGHSDSSTNQESPDHLSAPNLSSPYLLTLQGNEDVLVHSLEKRETLLGSDVVDFQLVASDVRPHHCIIKRDLEIFFPEENNFKTQKRWLVTITPLNKEAEVRINGKTLNSDHILKHGELVSIGKRHLFMFKDPSSIARLKQSRLPAQQSSATLLIAPDSSTDSIQNKTIKQNFVGTKSMKTIFNYSPEDEDKVFQLIFERFSNWETYQVEDVLTPANILCHCVFHSCLNFPPLQTSSSFEKVIKSIKTIVENHTQSVDEEMKLHGKTDSISVRSVIDTFDPVFYWLVNSLEMLNFFEHDFVRFVQKRLKKEKKRGLVEQHRLDELNKFEINPDWIERLKDVAATTFQNILYNITSILYELLPAIFNSNPFDINETKSQEITLTISLLSATNHKLHRYRINTNTENQFISYLFFFISSFLFNALMDKESSEKYFKWKTGVRIKGNLERIKLWASEMGYSSQCEKQFEKISALANLLATPTEKLLKTSWADLRRDFNSLSPLQLHRIVSTYQIPKHKSRPNTWFPEENSPDFPHQSGRIYDGYETLPAFETPHFPTNIDLLSMPGDSFTEKLCQCVNGRELLSLSHVHDNGFKVPPETKKSSILRSDQRNNQEDHEAPSNEQSMSSKSDVNKEVSNCSRASPNGIQTRKTVVHDGHSKTQPDIVKINLKKDEKGLGVGLVDGNVTSLETNGVFVRFIVPECSFDDETRIKHHDLLRCWPKQGRLQVGDRILAINGASLLDLSYEEAIHTLDEASDDVRLLISRGGHRTAIKILLPCK